MTRDEVIERMARAIVRAHAPGSNDPDAWQGGVHDAGCEWYDEGDPILAWHDVIDEAEAALDASGLWPVYKASCAVSRAVMTGKPPDMDDAIALHRALTAMENSNDRSD